MKRTLLMILCLAAAQYIAFCIGFVYGSKKQMVPAIQGWIMRTQNTNVFPLLDSATLTFTINDQSGMVFVNQDGRASFHFSGNVVTPRLEMTQHTP